MSDARNELPEEIVEFPREDGAARDGIEEADNYIPTWFTATFVASIAFALFYVPYYQFSGWTQIRQYDEESQRLEARFASMRTALPTSNPFRGDPDAIADGSVTFGTICLACHLADGSGLVGPSLIDPYWKYGTSDAELFATVAQGRPGGMPPWAAQLSSEKIWKVLLYIEQLPKNDEPGIGSPDFVAPAPPSGG